MNLDNEDASSQPLHSKNALRYPRAGKNAKSETETQQAPISKVKAEEKAKAKPGQRRPAASEVECIA